MKNNNKWSSFGKALGEVAKQVADATAQAAEANARIEKLRAEYAAGPSKRVLVAWRTTNFIENIDHSEQLVHVDGKALSEYLVVVPDSYNVRKVEVRVVDAADHTLLYDMAVFTSTDVWNAHRKRARAV